MAVSEVEASGVDHLSLASPQQPQPSSAHRSPVSEMLGSSSVTSPSLIPEYPESIILSHSRPTPRYSDLTGGCGSSSVRLHLEQSMGGAQSPDARF